MQNCIAICTGKGGVLKTTLACHLASTATSRFDRVLLVDCDPQGNAALDLGYRSDSGASLTSALQTGHRPTIMADVRPRLDVIAGGPNLDVLALAHLGDNSPVDKMLLRTMLENLAHPYGLIIIDTPARELTIRRMVLTAAGFVIAPSLADRASHQGLADLATTITEVRAGSNPRLDVLAVTAGAIPVGSTSVRARALNALANYIGDPELVSQHTIRQSSNASQQCRSRGQLSHEYANDYPSPSSLGLANDWKTLTNDLLDRYQHEIALTPQR